MGRKKVINDLCLPGWDSMVSLNPFSTHIKSLTGLRNKDQKCQKLALMTDTAYLDAVASTILIANPPPGAA